LSAYSEPNDLDTIYKVLKKAGEISQATDKNQASGTSQPPMEIPVVNVPDYPDRTPRRGQMKTLGPNLGSQPKQGLTAPMADMSSSGPINAAKGIIICSTKTPENYFLRTSFAFLLFVDSDKQKKNYLSNSDLSYLVSRNSHFLFTTTNLSNSLFAHIKQPPIR
jgi:hypothetical protein